MKLFNILILKGKVKVWVFGILGVGLVVLSIYILVVDLRDFRVIFGISKFGFFIVFKIYLFFCL